jgi:hypothetical protein
VIAVLKLLGDDYDPTKRHEIAEYMNMHPEAFEEFLTDVFTEKKDDIPSDIRYRIIDLIDLLNDKLVIMVVELAIFDQDPKVRLQGLQAGYRTRVDSLNDQVLQILNDRDGEFQARKWAVHILASTDSKRFGRVLRQMARNSSEDVSLRKEAVYALTKMEDSESIGALCALLGDSEVEIRQSGAWALSSIGSPDSMNCLLAALEDDDELVRDWAIRGLRDMNDSHALQGLANVLRNTVPDEQVRMIRLLVEKRSEIILRAIAELLTSSETDVRRSAAWAMGISPYPPAAASLEILQNDPDEQVRNYARKALLILSRGDPTEFGVSL